MNTSEKGPSTVKPRFDRSDLISVIALLSSVVALLLTAYEANIMKKQQEIMQEQQKASVWPYITTEVDFESDEKNRLTVSLDVKNKGIGPAMVKHVDILINNKTLDQTQTNQLGPELTKQLPEGARVIVRMEKVSDQLIAPDESKSWITIIISNVESPLKALNSIKLEAEFCYCSIYNDCWTHGTKGSPEQSTCHIKND